jgi:hypothetical protein
MIDNTNPESSEPAASLGADPTAGRPAQAAAGGETPAPAASDFEVGPARVVHHHAEELANPPAAAELVSPTGDFATTARLSWCRFPIKPKDRDRPLYRNELVCFGELVNSSPRYQEFAVFRGEQRKLFASFPTEYLRIGRSRWSVYEPKLAACSDILLDLVRRTHPRKLAAIESISKPRRLLKPGG